jgi:hypothetical protein
VFYKLLGVVTWKAIKFYVVNKVPKKAVVGALAVLVFGVAAAVAGAAAKAGEGE